MTPAGFERLSFEAASRFLEFVAHPLASLHPERRRSLLPEGLADLPGCDALSLSQGILNELGLTDDLREFDFGDPLHRMALLPPEGLEAVSLALGLRMLAPRLLLAVTREDALAIESALTGYQQQVLAQAAGAGWPAPASGAPSVRDLLAEFPRAGLSLATGLLRELPRELGLRGLLKLPPAEAADMSERRPWLADLIGQTVSHWDAAWARLWVLQEPAPGVA